MKTKTVEPFGENYTLKMAKQDSDRLLTARKLNQMLKAMNPMSGYTIVSLSLLIGWTGLVAQASV